MVDVVASSISESRHAKQIPVCALFAHSLAYMLQRKDYYVCRFCECVRVDKTDKIKANNNCPNMLAPASNFRSFQ